MVYDHSDHMLVCYTPLIFMHYVSFLVLQEDPFGHLLEPVNGCSRSQF